MWLNAVLVLSICIVVHGFRGLTSKSRGGRLQLAAELPIDEFDNFAREHAVLQRYVEGALHFCIIIL